MAANFQLIPSEDARKRTKNVHPYMQFYFIEKKAKNVSCHFYDEVLKITAVRRFDEALTDVGTDQFAV